MKITNRATREHSNTPNDRTRGDTYLLAIFVFGLPQRSEKGRTQESC